MSDDWFTVDRKGLAQLYADKPKWYIIRELLQNALDEARETIHILTQKKGKTVTISVEDDGPGFRDITDSYRLFGDTYKRSEPEKRGRFNTGEKWAFALCKSATVFTTSGTVTFDQGGRHVSKRRKKSCGTIVTVDIVMNNEEYQNMHDYLNTWIIPQNIIVSLDNVEIGHDIWDNYFKKFDATLPTEYAKEGGVMQRTTRKTQVVLFRNQGPSFLYEMGIPVFEVDLPYHVDVQQKIPLNSDRDMVTQSFLKALYTAVLNNSYEEVTEETASETWVRIATEGKNVDRSAVERVLDQRYGRDRVTATPNDPIANDEAKANGFTLVHGSMMSGAEWKNVKGMGLIASSSEKFGMTFVDAEDVDLTGGMRLVERLAKAIANEFQDNDITVRFVMFKSSTMAQYGDRELTFNVEALDRAFFNDPLSSDVLDLIIHELGHEKGHHTEKAYHQELTRLAGELIVKGIKEPEWFKKVVEYNG